MAILIYGDRIRFNNYELKINGTGLVARDLVGDTHQLSNFAAARNDDIYVGNVSAYSSGGSTSTSLVSVNTIDKFPFAADTNASDVGDITSSRSRASGQSSSVSGYLTAGYEANYVNTINKFPFATNANASDVGDTTQAKQFTAGQSSTTNGYATGGNTPGNLNVIDRFPFATDANTTDIADLTRTVLIAAGQSSTTHGYTSGGNTIPGSPGNQNVIDRFPFATNANATDVGDLTVSRGSGSGGISSSESGYTCGGYIVTAIFSNVIDKFPFATNANATDVGDLDVVKVGVMGHSSFNTGYASGGFPTSPASTVSNVIQKFPFATNANGTDIADLTQGRYNAAAQQY